MIQQENKYTRLNLQNTYYNKNLGHAKLEKLQHSRISRFLIFLCRSVVVRDVLRWVVFPPHGVGGTAAAPVAGSAAAAAVPLLRRRPSRSCWASERRATWTSDPRPRRVLRHRSTQHHFHSTCLKNWNAVNSWIIPEVFHVFLQKSSMALGSMVEDYDLCWFMWAKDVPLMRALILGVKTASIYWTYLKHIWHLY